MKQEKFQFKDIVWKDFSLIVIFIVTMFILSNASIVYGTFYLEERSESSDMLLSSLAQLLAYVVTIFCFYFLHWNDFEQRFKANAYYLKRHVFFLLMIFITMFICSYGYNVGVQYLPGDLGFDETQNERELNILFQNPKFLPFTFLLVVVAAAFVEEIVFRHLLIGELGKKFNFKVMGVISAVLFSLMHVTGAESPLEFGSYFILAIGLVYAYLKSGRKLISSLSLHMLNNLISFILTIYTLN
ncbi:CPBP family intramembrane metalloprotease [Staphylococcus succinus]|uniref:CPBP family intramembrane glutamic endopeptidase n=1 Tax=Staphylococcus succinus TaxID=61015 RepID=UPI0009372797|nr:CPBP family intramembrane glutamic endopeptidase [Staphylococcus succinus]MEB8127075.1 CPBP family intramembrane metalloprotease [Staphylococcus succinus]MEB8209918.1 CPBP family intramembrane metalloprotease [Staphylococcus succinus]PTI41126.1 CPBP family intramembrane metalloprotease [Staphylococcus succinus]RIN34131.1 CPBP family intramembrane metalloprotease [Staphylococcus succinus]